MGIKTNDGSSLNTGEANIEGLYHPRRPNLWSTENKFIRFGEKKKKK